uniref:Uncharacterized protein n=1 Tax=Cacopsylla melanoneura TaxID=428564 RepID=A0A8D9ARL8_9HEMI
MIMRRYLRGNDWFWVALLLTTVILFKHPFPLQQISQTFPQVLLRPVQVLGFVEAIHLIQPHFPSFLVRVLNRAERIVWLLFYFKFLERFSQLGLDVEFPSGTAWRQDRIS